MFRKFVLGSWLMIGASTVAAECFLLSDDIEEASRFVVNSAEAFDPRTQLHWQRCSAGTQWQPDAGCAGQLTLMGLNEAQRYADSQGKGWRLPTLEELYSIVDQQCESPVLDPSVFPDVKIGVEGAPYWSRSEVEGLPKMFYFVDFMDGSVDGHSRGFSLAVRLVRSE